MISKWIRRLHRWAVFPFTFVLGAALLGGIVEGAAFQLPGWLGAIGALSLLTVALTGFYMFIQYYWVIWRRTKRATVS